MPEERATSKFWNEALGQVPKAVANNIVGLVFAGVLALVAGLAITGNLAADPNEPDTSRGPESVPTVNEEEPTTADDEDGRDDAQTDSTNSGSEEPTEPAQPDAIVIAPDDFVGEPYDRASRLLTDSGLKPLRTDVATARQLPGHIDEIESGRFSSGDEVEIDVATAVEMPHVVGVTYSEAARILEANGSSVKREEGDWHADGIGGQVASQSVAAGKDQQPTITLTVHPAGRMARFPSLPVVDDGDCGSGSNDYYDFIDHTTSPDGAYPTSWGAHLINYRGATCVWWLIDLSKEWHLLQGSFVGSDRSQTSHPGRLIIRGVNGNQATDLYDQRVIRSELKPVSLSGLEEYTTLYVRFEMDGEAPRRKRAYFGLVNYSLRGP